MLVMSIFTLFGFSGIAYFILSFSDKVDYFEMFNYDHLITSIPIGLGFGALAALIGALLLKTSCVKRNKYFLC